MNSVQLLGNLARDPEVMTTATNRTVARFTVVTNYEYMDNMGEKKTIPSFINCVAWGKLANSAGQLRKGQRCFVEGRLTSRSYETQDGQKRSVTEVNANFIGVPAGTTSDVFSDGVTQFGTPSDSNFSGGFDDVQKSGEDIPF